MEWIEKDYLDVKDGPDEQNRFKNPGLASVPVRSDRYARVLCDVLSFQVLPPHRGHAR